MRLVVTLVLLASLLFEAQALVEGVVQLRVRVDDLFLADKGFEALAETGIRAMVLGERGHHLRVPGYEGWGDASFFDKFANELVEHAGVGHGR